MERTQPGTISRKRGIALRISEAYEHEPILPYQAEDNCPVGGCNKTGTQCVDIAAPFALTPTASVGTVTVACQGSPSITCVTDASGSCCTVTMTPADLCICSHPLRREPDRRRAHHLLRGQQLHRLRLLLKAARPARCRKIRRRASRFVWILTENPALQGDGEIGYTIP